MLVVTVLAALLALVSLGLGVRALAITQPRFETRIAARLRGPVDPDAAARPTLTELFGPRLLQTLIRWGERAGRGGLDSGKRQALKLTLVQAGYYSPRAAEAFFGIRAAAAGGFAVLGVAIAVAMEVGSVAQAAFLVAAAANIGLFAPKVVLRRKVTARGQAVRQALPDAIDLMVVAVEAGSTLNSAIQRVQAEFKALHPVLAEQLGILMMEMQAGASRAEALTRLAERAPIDEVKSLANLLIQSEAVGASLGGTLRVFADEMRKRRYIEAERKATELPVKIAFPLVFCIFPCLTGVIFIPIAIRFLRTLFV